MYFKKLIVLSLIVLITGCSGTYHAYYTTLKLAFSDNPGVELKLATINNASWDYLQVKNGEQSKIVLALGFIENGQNKWVSADKGLLVIVKGRIVKTHGLDLDLLYVSEREHDPLKKLAQDNNNDFSATWQRTTDWSNSEYGYQLQSSIEYSKTEHNTWLEHDFETKLYIEQVHFDNPSQFIQPQNTWNNYYWYEVSSGELVKSIQTLHPLSEPIEMLYLSRLARIIVDSNSESIDEE